MEGTHTHTHIFGAWFQSMFVNLRIPTFQLIGAIGIFFFLLFWQF